MVQITTIAKRSTKSGLIHPPTGWDPDSNAVSIEAVRKYPDRFLYGSDWPLIPMQGYRQFIADMLPEEWMALVFEENARMLFSRLS